MNTSSLVNQLIDSICATRLKYTQWLNFNRSQFLELGVPNEVGYVTFQEFASEDPVPPPPDPRLSREEQIRLTDVRVRIALARCARAEAL